MQFPERADVTYPTPSPYPYASLQSLSRRKAREGVLQEYSSHDFAQDRLNLERLHLGQQLNQLH